MEPDPVHALIEGSLKKQPTMEICNYLDCKEVIRPTGATILKILEFKNFDCLYPQSRSPFISKKKNIENRGFLISIIVYFQIQTESQMLFFIKPALMINFNLSFKCLSIDKNSHIIA